LTESVLNFGPNSRLVGILTQPEARIVPDLALVMLNSGILHRVGPNRIYVRLARHLASAGHLSFRLDLAGVGDSATLGTSESVQQEALRSISAALDLLEARGVARRFILLGLCSGAQDAFLYTLGDPRVVGVAGIDPPTLFRSRKYYSLRARIVLRRPRVWVKFLLGKYRIIRSLFGLLVGSASHVPGTDLTMSEAKAFVRQGLSEMVGRQVRFLLLVTGSARESHNYRTQLLDVFPGLGLDRIGTFAFYPEADHTLSREIDRSRFENEVSAWLQAENF